HITDLFGQDDRRTDRYGIDAPSLFIDFSKNLIDDAALETLIRLAEEQELPARIQDLFNGEQVNNTEQRPALHTALRQLDDTPVRVDGQNVIPMIHAARERMRSLIERLHEGVHLGYSGKPLTTLVSIGIGGSYLGPKAALEALTPYT